MIAHETAPCLTSSGRGVERTGDTRGQDPVVAHAAVAFTTGNLSRGAGSSPNVEVSQTLQAQHGRGATDQHPCVAHAIAVDLQNVRTGGTHGVNQHPEVSPAVKVGSGLGIPSPPAVAHAAVAFPINGMCLNKELRDKQMTGVGKGNDPMFTVRADGTQHAVAHAMTVRRLTPRECERLQGFPDDYTAIPWRGKAETPDGPRYKALGNSMAVNCMAWIGERIAGMEAR